MKLLLRKVQKKMNKFEGFLDMLESIWSFTVEIMGSKLFWFPMHQEQAPVGVRTPFTTFFQLNHCTV